MSIEFDLECDECGTSLEVELLKGYSNQNRITVKPCEKCTDGFREQIETLQEQISDLEDAAEKLVENESQA
jgi:uncharacterized Zn finger protein